MAALEVQMAVLEVPMMTLDVPTFENIPTFEYTPTFENTPTFIHKLSSKLMEPGSNNGWIKVGMDISSLLCSISSLVLAVR